MTFQHLTGDAATDVAALRAWLADHDPDPLLITTSGSTGEPKRVVLSRDAVVANATASLARAGGAGPWHLQLPSSYVAGVQVVVRSLLSGFDPVLGEEPGGAVATSLVPTQLRRMLDAGGAAEAGYDLVLLGGGPIDPSLRADAEAAGVRVVATYGSSETAGGCVYDGVPLDGVEVRIEEPDAGGVGRIALRGPMLFDYYDGAPDLTAESLVDGWFRTSDLGRFDGVLSVLGRVDDVVISGGVNVPTPAVAARLREHPDVSDAAVLGVPDPEWGHRVVAFVVGRLGRREARDWVGEVHPRAWAPREVRVLAALPLLGNGKVDRQALLEELR